MKDFFLNFNDQNLNLSICSVKCKLFNLPKHLWDILAASKTLSLTDILFGMPVQFLNKYLINDCLANGDFCSRFTQSCNQGQEIEIMLDRVRRSQAGTDSIESGLAMTT